MTGCFRYDDTCFIVNTMKFVVFIMTLSCIAAIIFQNHRMGCIGIVGIWCRSHGNCLWAELC